MKEKGGTGVMVNGGLETRELENEVVVKGEK